MIGRHALGRTAAGRAAGGCFVPRPIRRRDDGGVSGLRLEDVHKAFGDHPVLSGVDLEVPAGAFTAILGPSGSGKSTLLRLVAGFERPDRGTVSVGGRQVEGAGRYVPPEERRIGYVPQEGGLFPHLTVEANVGFGLRRSERRSRATELLEGVGLADLGGRYPHQLSGGQQQRVALARALAVRPEVVLLDEPFVSLDANLRASVREDVRRVLKEAGATAILVTHDQDEALSLADLVAVLRGGRIAQCASPHDLYRSPIDADMARFVGDANILSGVLGPGSVRTALGTLAGRLRDGQLPSGSEVAVLVRPEQIEVSAGPPGGAGSEGLAGRVVWSGYHGHDAVTRVRLLGNGGESIVVRTMGDVQPAVGADVSVEVRGPVVAWPAADRRAGPRSPDPISNGALQEGTTAT